MDSIVIALSSALALSLLASIVLATLYWSERTKHHAAKDWAEAEVARFKAYQASVENERQTLIAQKSAELVQPLFDQISS